MTRADRQRRLRWRIGSDPVNYRVAEAHLCFKDILYGTHTRPCPKYGRQGDRMGLRTAPDVFLFPQHIPQVRDPEPPVHTLETLRLPGLVLDLFGVPKHSRWKHVWTVHVNAGGGGFPAPGRNGRSTGPTAARRPLVLPLLPRAGSGWR